MAKYPSTFEPLDYNNEPMGFALDPNDLVDSMNPTSSCQLSDLCWSDKDSFDMFSWNLGGINQSFHPLSETVNQLELEPHSSSHTSSPHELSAGYPDYMIKTEDGLSNASPVSDPGSDLWSPSLLQDTKSSGSSSLDSIGAATRARHNDNGDDDDHNQKPATMPRKDSNASTISSGYSELSPLASPKSTTQKLSNTKSSRPVLSHDNDAVAVMKRKKAAHNAIEKRYRTNMNAKFLALGNAIPRAGMFSSTSLASHKGQKKSSAAYQAARGSASSGSANRQQNEQQQNKSEILTNALSYIQELQDENSRLKTELLVLKENLLPRSSMMWRR